MDNVQKPIDLIVEDTKRELVNVLNNSGLPITIINLMVNSLAIEVNNTSQSTLTQLRESYNSQLNEQE